MCDHDGPDTATVAVEGGSSGHSPSGRRSCEAYAVKRLSGTPATTHCGISGHPSWSRPTCQSGQFNACWDTRINLITEIYLHSIGDSEREAMQALNDGLAENSHTESHTKAKLILLYIRNSIL
jgi:hypothetical protein